MVEVHIPDLLQLCAEQVISDAAANKYYDILSEYIEQLMLPKIPIIYIKENTYFVENDFRNLILMKSKNINIVRSVPEWTNLDFKLSVGKEKLLYICSISDLGKDMLKIDFPMGEYGIHPFRTGYILKTKEYAAKVDDAVHVFNFLSRNKGLSATYFGQVISNAEHLRLFNTFISEYMTDISWWSNHTDHRFRTVLKYIDEYSDIPVVFYLTCNINSDDLCKITLTCNSPITNCGNVDACWYVFHLEKGRIGIAVKQTIFYNMVATVAGVCLLSSNGFRAVGNFDKDVRDLRDGYIDQSIYCAEHEYRCDYKPCSCDVMDLL